MGPFADVFAKVDSPKKSAVELVCFENGGIGHAGLRIIAATPGLVKDDFILAVPVEVAD